MKKLLFALLATLTYTNATAEWIRVGGSGGDSDIYVDPTTTRQKAALATIWSMDNFMVAQGKSKETQYSSSRIYWEFDCLGERMRITSFSTFSNKMGAGEIVDFNNSPHREWEPIPPGTVGLLIGGIACDKTTGKTTWTTISKPDEVTDMIGIGIKDNFYINRNAATRTGDLVQMWQLQDFISERANAQSDNFSMKTRMEYDCRKAQKRILSWMIFEANMGIGRPELVRDEVSEWSPVVPGTLYENLWNKACDK